MPLLLLAGLALAGSPASPSAASVFAADPVVSLLASELKPAALRKGIAQLAPHRGDAIAELEYPFLVKWAEAAEAEARGDLEGAIELYDAAHALPRWETPSGAVLLDRARASRKLQILENASFDDDDSCAVDVHLRERVASSMAVAADLVGYVAYVEGEFSAPEWSASPDVVKDDFARRDEALKALQFVLAEYAAMPRPDVANVLAGGSRCN